MKNNKIEWRNVFACEEQPELDFVLDGLLAGTVGSICAQGSTGKSFYGLELCLAIAAKNYVGMGIKVADPLTVAEATWLEGEVSEVLSSEELPPNTRRKFQAQLDYLIERKGHFMTSERKSTRTAYLTAEDPADILFSRLFNIAADFDVDAQLKVMSRVDVYSLHGEGICLLNAKGEVDDKCREGAARLREIASGRRLLICDTLRRFSQAEENNSGHMTTLLGVIEAISHETGCAIIFLHHVSKSANGSDQVASRGSSALTDNVRWQLNLVTMSDDEALRYGIPKELAKLYVKAVGAKANYRAENRDSWLKRGKGGVLREVELQERQDFSSKKTSKETESTDLF